MIYVSTYMGLMFMRFAQIRGLYPFIIAMLFVFSAFRYDVGCDWSGYLNQFNVYQVLPPVAALSTREPLWVGMFLLQNQLGLPYPWINVASSIIFFAGVHMMARRQPNPLAFLVLLFPILIVNMPMSGIRQATAIGVMCMAYVAFVDQRLIRFVVLTVLAASFHSSAMVFLLLTPLVTGKYSRNRIAMAVLLAIPGTLVLIGTDAADTATSRYIETDIDAAGAAFRIGLLVLTSIFFFVALRMKWARQFPEDYKLIALSAWIMLGLGALLPVSSVIGDRLGYYLIPLQTVIFARIPYLNLGANRQLLSIAPYFGLLLVFAVWTSNSSHFQKCYLPYQSWVFGVPSAL